MPKHLLALDLWPRPEMNSPVAHVILNSHQAGPPGEEVAARQHPFRRRSSSTTRYLRTGWLLERPEGRTMEGEDLTAITRTDKTAACLTDRHFKKYDDDDDDLLR